MIQQLSGSEVLAPRKEKGHVWGRGKKRIPFNSATFTTGTVPAARTYLETRENQSVYEDTTKVYC